MPQLRELSRRTFLKGAGTTAALGAVGARPTLAGAQGLPASGTRQTFDFDEIYDRRGSESIKWDRPIEGVEAEIEVGMGIADMDFRAALIEGDDWLDQLLPYIDANHDFVERYLRENIPAIKYTKAQGTYLAWLDVSELPERVGAREMAERENGTAESTVTPEEIMQRWFGNNARVYLNPGSAYGTGGAGHMRMNLATSRLLIRRALDNISAAVATA